MKKNIDAENNIDINSLCFDEVLNLLFDHPGLSQTMLQDILASTLFNFQILAERIATLENKQH